jgi:geranylgeranyl pyrophosphate synthase
VDDVLDVEGSPRSLGKTPGKDRAQAHFTYVDLMGAPGARAHARDLASRALAALPRIRGGDLRPLAALARFVVEREH